MVYIRKVAINNKDYFYLFHTIRENGKFKKLSRYIGKRKPSKSKLKAAKQKFLNEIKLMTKGSFHEEESNRKNILENLRRIQDENGCLPEKDIRKLSNKTKIPVVEIYGMASFYSMFSFEKKGRKVIRVCNSPSCYLNGSLNILKEIKRILKIDVGETTKDGKFTLELSSCMGCCDKAPAIMINEELITRLTKDKIKKLLR